MERVIQASSKEGDLVLDPFCGCGTAVAVAQRLKRRWIGIDITHLAISLIKGRLQSAYGEEVHKTYTLDYWPETVFEATELAEKDRYDFQWWALSLVGACPALSQRKKGADRGTDGRLYFYEVPRDEKPKLVVLSVKSGNLKPEYVRDLRGVVEREKAAIGVLITLNDPTKQMRTEAAEAGSYVSPWGGQKYRKIQILTVEQLLNGQRIDKPGSRDSVAFPKLAPKRMGAELPKQGELFGQGAG